MEATRIRAPFDRVGDTDERWEEREHVGMGDSSGTLIAVWLRFRVACRRTPILCARKTRRGIEEGTCKRFGS
jgi:hypothetical protein